MDDKIRDFKTAFLRARQPRTKWALLDRIFAHELGLEYPYPEPDTHNLEPVVRRALQALTWRQRLTLWWERHFGRPYVDDPCDRLTLPSFYTPYRRSHRKYPR